MPIRYRMIRKLGYKKCCPQDLNESRCLDYPSYKALCPNKEAEDYIFFSCDYDYFDRYGYALAQSINRTLSWMHVHCHIIDEGNMNKEVLDTMSNNYNFTYSFEEVKEGFYESLAKNNKRMKEGMNIFKTKDLNFIARKTYLASARFMRLSQLFKHNHQYVLQLDCDTVLKNGFHQADFRDLTMHVSVMPKPKDPAVFIASAICLGTGQNGVMFRICLVPRMIEAFEKPIIGTLTQDVLKVLIRMENKLIKNMDIFYKWVSWGLKKKIFL